MPWKMALQGLFCSSRMVGIPLVRRHCTGTVVLVLDLVVNCIGTCTPTMKWCLNPVQSTGLRQYGIPVQSCGATTDCSSEMGGRGCKHTEFPYCPKAVDCTGFRHSRRLLVKLPTPTAPQLRNFLRRGVGRCGAVARRSRGQRRAGRLVQRALSGG